MCILFFNRLCCRGLTPSEAELYYLDNAKNLALYGMHMHEAKVMTLCCSLSSDRFNPFVKLNTNQNIVSENIQKSWHSVNIAAIS